MTPAFDAALLEEMKMKHQVGTESGVVSNEAAKQLRILITDLARTVQNLDASAGAGADDVEFTRLLATRRRNLMVTIATLEDHVKMQSRDAAKLKLTQARGEPPH